MAVAGAVLQASDQMGRYGLSLFLDKTIMLTVAGLLPVAWTSNPLAVLACYATSSTLVSAWALWTVGVHAWRPVMP